MEVLKYKCLKCVFKHSTVGNVLIYISPLVVFASEEQDPKWNYQGIVSGKDLLI